MILKQGMQDGTEPVMVQRPAQVLQRSGEAALDRPYPFAPPRSACAACRSAKPASAGRNRRWTLTEDEGYRRQFGNRVVFGSRARGQGGGLERGARPAAADPFASRPDARPKFSTLVPHLRNPAFHP